METSLVHKFYAKNMSKALLCTAETCLLVDEHEFLVRTITHFLLEVN